MKLFVLNRQNSIANQYLKELRDVTDQADRLRFRKNMERLGEVMAYEVSKNLIYKKTTVTTPLGKSQGYVLQEQPVLATVLRAGLPYFQGFLNFFDQADCGFIGAYRKESGEDLTINLEYLATPGLGGKQLILIDPMLATGKSFVKALHALLKNGTPAHVHLVALVAAPEGLKFVQESVTVPASLYVCAIDENLNDQFYIVPGLGDAGDLSFGEKQ